MADLAIPGAVQPADGGALVATDINTIFDDPTAPEDSLSVINGTLDYLNFDVGPDFLVPAELTQRGSFAQGWSVSGTANLDWRWTWFSNWQTPAETAATGRAVADTDPIQYIPGACLEFYAPSTGYALIQWTVFWNNDSYAGPISAASEMMLLIDGTYQTAQRRKVTYVGDTSANPQGYARHRAWTGHALVSVTQGWHRAGIALLADEDIRNTRTHAVSMQAVWFNV